MIRYFMNTALFLISNDLLTAGASPSIIRKDEIELASTLFPNQDHHLRRRLMPRPVHANMNRADSLSSGEERRAAQQSRQRQEQNSKQSEERSREKQHVHTPRALPREASAAHRRGGGVPHGDLVQQREREASAAHWVDVPLDDLFSAARAEERFFAMVPQPQVERRVQKYFSAMEFDQAEATRLMRERLMRERPQAEAPAIPERKHAPPRPNFRPAGDRSVGRALPEAVRMSSFPGSSVNNFTDMMSFLRIPQSERDAARVREEREVALANEEVLIQQEESSRITSKKRRGPTEDTGKDAKRRPDTQ
eukprot:GHVH01011411.1.p1 GENE.GHVH01011411.1~~GHVH01011411.1.p1  ORF type:complete len:308 (+),score=44.14 GHVH01011411.1:163-1086(+)